MLTQDNINFKWKEIRGGIRNLWGKLTVEEIDQAKENLYSLADIVSEKHRESFETFREKLKALLNSFDNDSDKGLLKDVSSYQRAPVRHENYPKNSPSAKVQPVMDNYNPEEAATFGSDSSK